MLAQKLEKMGLRKGQVAGKVALVTGAGSGIGRELALSLSWMGAAVVIAELRESGRAVEKEIVDAGGEALFVQADISRAGAFTIIREQAVKRFGRVDILVNNATGPIPGTIAELPLEEWDHSYALELRAVVEAIKVFLPEMLLRKSGVIVTVTSSEGMPYIAPYSAFKAAVVSLAYSLAAELGDATGVDVFVFGPGMVDTPAIRNMSQYMAPRMGMTQKQFLEQNVNAGYEGIMPAEDCGAAFAYAIANAHEYHGQTVGAVQPLMKYKVAPLIAVEEMPPSIAPKQAIPPTNADIRTLSSEVVEVVGKLAKEADEANFFVKSWLRRNTQQRTGKTIKEWVEFAETLQADCAKLEAMSDDPVAQQSIAKSLRARVPDLLKLAEFFKGQKEDVKGFFKDPKQRDEALVELDRRETVMKRMAREIGAG